MKRWDINEHHATYTYPIFQGESVKNQLSLAAPIQPDLLGFLCYFILLFWQSGPLKLKTKPAEQEQRPSDQGTTLREPLFSALLPLPPRFLHCEGNGLPPKSAHYLALGSDLGLFLSFALHSRRRGLMASLFPPISWGCVTWHLKQNLDPSFSPQFFSYHSVQIRKIAIVQPRHNHTKKKKKLEVRRTKRILHIISQ